MIIDTHTHIYTEEFDADRADVVARALEAGVGIMLLPNINAESIAPLLDTCHKWPDVCYPLIGLHPEDVRENYAEVLEKMKKFFLGQQADATLSQRVDSLTCGLADSFIGIGEVGLDFYWDTTYKAEQLRAFEQQLGWAATYHLPVVIHQRAAFDELYILMEQFRDEALTGIFHCFGGTVEEAEKLLSFPGFMLGIGGTVTYKKSTLPNVLRQSVPLSRIVVETDAPYLAPVPHRGQRNEPSFIIDTVHRLADIYSTTPEAVAEQTAANARTLFPTL
jgi:Mg-dependent DNase